jgi:hypothetical protein
MKIKDFFAKGDLNKFNLLREATEIYDEHIETNNDRSTNH